MASLYERNLLLLQQNMPEVHKMLMKKESVPFPVSTSYDKSKKMLFCVRDDVQCYLHSIYNRDRELAELKEQIGDKADMLLLFGLGDGRTLDFLLENYGQLERLIIVEPSVDIFRNTLQYFDLLNINKYCKELMLIVGMPVEVVIGRIAKAIHKKFNMQFQLCYHMSSRSLFNKYYVEMASNLTHMFRETMMNISTLHGYRNLWPKNAIKNLQLSHIPGSALNGIFKNIPAILVSAGPSLEKNIDLLPELLDKALIVTACTVITIFENKGIRPHLRFAFDAAPTNLQLFENIAPSDIPLIFSGRFYPAAAEQYTGPRMKVVLNNEFITQYVYKKIGIACSIDSDAYSVSNFAAAKLAAWGCNPVILIGQDLALTGKKRYAAGAPKYTNDPINIVGEDKFDFDKSQIMMKVKGLQGEDLYTDKAFIAIRGLFTEIAQVFKDTEFINCTEGGFPIDAIPNRRLKDVVSNFDNFYDIRDIIEKHISDYDLSADNEIYRSKLPEVIAEMKDELISISEIITRRDLMLLEIQENINNGLSVDVIEDEFGKFDKMETEELEPIGYYTEVAKKCLKSSERAIRMGYTYYGDDRMEKVVNQISMIRALNAVLLEHCQIMLANIK